MIIDVGDDHIVRACEVAMVRAMAKTDKHSDRVDVVLRSGFLFTLETPSFEVAQGRMRNINAQLRGE